MFGIKPKEHDFKDTYYTREYNNCVRRANEKVDWKQMSEMIKHKATLEAGFIQRRNEKIFDMADKEFKGRFPESDPKTFEIDKELTSIFKISRPVHEAIPRPPATNPNFIEGVVPHEQYSRHIGSLKRHFTFNNNGDISSGGGSGGGGLYIARSR